MESVISRLIVQSAPRARRRSAAILSDHRKLAFTTFRARSIEQPNKNPFGVPGNAAASYAQPAANVSQNVYSEEKDHFARVEAQSKAKQRTSPWMREGSDVPPVRRKRSAGAMTKGKLLTTPSRMLKFILPLSTRDGNSDRKDVEPLALLVHPQQPLSYLERLVQSELPVMEDGRAPSVTFRAEDSGESEGKKAVEQDEEAEKEDEESQEQEEDLAEGAESMKIDGKVVKMGKISAATKGDEAVPAHGHVNAAQPGSDAAKAIEQSQEDKDPAHANFVRWSPSTEIGDFIRDAARGKEFAVDIQNSPPIYVGVPSFADRTYYLRMRLRKTATRISAMADVKKESDDLAQKAAKRVAQGGFAGLIGWWGVVYYLTFKTDLGWDVMEPVTYLVGLSGLIGGYMWFLYHNREVSYRSAMNFTVSRRQSQLYEQKGFDLAKWEMLVEEGNRLRREIKLVAEEYDVEWDETRDEGDEKVREALRKERQKKGGKDGKGKDKKEDEEDD
ncbi:hypothetical protein B0A48_15737 [Cryoendolithus antarcticus]|uniref:Calcium uniporter protein, mitochondrial n=1 Tax=Cryoendolithus antarcticus TaxID=1507870 RepID=A0A1V8SHF8_9PEZI|nr:hypothetical protein B0A48_15737 [Cryoendolithus antarcticus]